MRALLAAALLLAMGPQAALAQAEAKADNVTKKRAWLEDKASRQAAVDESQRAALDRELAVKVGKEPEPVINIFNSWTHETIVVAKDAPKGAARARKRINGATDVPEEVASWHLRCHFTNEPAEMDGRLFQVLVEAARYFDSTRVEIVSGFRAPKYNLTLRKKGREVARSSHHTLGEAVDFRVPGVTTPKLRNWAKGLRLGGVGYYEGSGFIHVDIGKVRTWRGE